MKSPFDPEPPQEQMPQIRLEDLDFAKLTRIVKWVLLAVILIVIWGGVSWGRTFYTDWLWFSSLGHEQVLLRIITAKIWLFLLGALIFAVLAAPNLYAAFRFDAGMKPQGSQGFPAKSLEHAKKLLILVAVGATVLAALFLAGRPASEWEMILCFLNGVAFNQTDPVFQKDFSFYVFTLPALGFVRSWLITVVVLIMIIVAGFHYISAMLRGERFALIGKVKAHLAVLGAGLFVLIAVGHWLSRYELLFSPTGTVFGVGYTDDHVTLPVRMLLTVIALVSSGLLIASIYSKANRLILYSVGLWVAMNLLAGSVVPGLVQRLIVEPSELARETPYLASNIKLTRQAYGLEQLQDRSHPALGELDAQIAAQNEGTIQNVRLWDEGPLLQIYNQIQFFRLYYDFVAVHTDRYRPDGQLRQVMLATRELAAEKLPAEAQRWVNRHLQFTHGYGVAMSPVTEVEADGRPTFLVQDVPPVGKIPLKHPEIYYGLKSLDFMITRSGMQEFNYPGPDGPVYTHYEGKGGVVLSSFFRRLIYAWQFMDINILISGEVNPDSIIQYRRTVQERFSTVTPFLMRDQEAYSVVADGRMFWIQDAYTVTDRFPYSTPFQRMFNYMRNSVKAVVDAYHGTLDYYVFDPADPLIRTYQAIFPGLFKSMDELPAFLQQHIRYPLDLFNVQTEMLLQYHMQDPVVFYNKEDQWDIPVQTSFGETEALKPYYIVARLPGEEKEEFILIQPFTPNNRHNLVGWMAARNDGKAYGELVLFRFPTGRHVDGPNQVEARIDNDAVISEQFTLWGQVGSEVSRGILLVIPLGDYLLYAEPVFLKPETLDFPELRRIILADSRQIAMHQTLDDSIQALVGRLPAVAPVVEVEEELVAPTAPGLIPDALETLRRGLQEAVDKLQEALEQLKGITQ
ncbi:UPF0182 family protein [Deltaproteobacteria bacterium]|nr:UPF0182 family protein [Deltaproteobacteria bacterium]